MPNLVERICRNCGTKKDIPWKDFTRWLRKNSGRPLEDYLCHTCTLKLRNQTHGGSGTPIYKRWKSMFVRTRGQSLKANVKYYVEKGITVCPEWHDFKNFERWALENGFQPELTLDRIDGNKNYEPSNCRWIPQGDNVRNKSNHDEFVENCRQSALKRYRK